MENLPHEILKELCLYLDVISITHFTSSCKSVRKIKYQIDDRVNEYKKVIKKKRWNQGLHISSMKGDIQQINFFIEKGADRYELGLYGAALGGHKDLVQFFIDILKKLNERKYPKPYIIERAASFAAEGGHKDLIEFIVDNCHYQISDELCWGCALQGAAKGGYRDIIELAISKGADGWDQGMNGAARSGNKEFVEFFISKGANYWNGGMHHAALGGHKDIIEFFIKQGADNWNMGLYGAAQGGYKDLIDFFIEKGADYLDPAMRSAAFGGHKDIIKLLINKGVSTDWKELMRSATEGGHEDLIHSFWIKHSCKVAMKYAIIYNIKMLYMLLMLLSIVGITFALIILLFISLQSGNIMLLWASLTTIIVISIGLSAYVILITVNSK